LSRTDWQELTELVELAAYRLAPPAPEQAQRARELLRRLPHRSWRERWSSTAVALQAHWQGAAWRPAWLSPMRVAELQAGRGFIWRMALSCGLIGYAIAYGVSVLFNGGSVRLPLVTVFGSLPAIALTLAAGGAGLTVCGIWVAQGRWAGWIRVGVLGMPVITGLATVAGEVGQVVVVSLFERGQVWWHSWLELVANAIVDVLILLPFSLTIGFLLGLVLFGAAGLVWVRRLEQGD
jgi:hypothetical protein